jgi:hypothetical protein
VRGHRIRLKNHVGQCFDVKDGHRKEDLSLISSQSLILYRIKARLPYYEVADIVRYILPTYGENTFMCKFALIAYSIRHKKYEEC